MHLFWLLSLDDVGNRSILISKIMETLKILYYVGIKNDSPTHVNKERWQKIFYFKMCVH